MLSDLPPLRMMLAFVTVVSLPAVVQQHAAWHDPSPHNVSFVSVDQDVRLEVLDWGGSGRTLVLLTGLGDNAHVYDDFAPKLSAEYRVMAITRRGFGASTIAPSGYGANRLGDDVLAVLDSLKLEKPVLVGHSVAGAELSSVGSRHPERVAGLVYLDAAYQYAFDNGKGTTMAELREGVDALPALPPPTPADLASYTALATWWERTRGFKVPEAALRQGRRTSDDGKPAERLTPPSVQTMVQDGRAKFSEIHVPVLALCAMPQVTPHYLLDMGPDVRRAAEGYDARHNLLKEKQLKAFEEGIPSAKVVRIRNADHYIFISNEFDVLREMRSFISTLK